MNKPPTAPIPAGWFWMGSNDGPENEQPMRRVWVDAFEMGVFAVSNREYALFLEAAGHEPPPFWQNPKLNAPNQPVVGPSWHDAGAYIEWLSEAVGAAFRLPTEAEREKAARGGLDRRAYPWGDALPANAEGGRHTPLEPVDAYAPNGYGLYGMASGVHEWCSDWYEPSYCAAAPERNPRGPAAGERKAARGGSWRHSVRFTRCAARSALAPDKRFSDFGFRLALG